jgi:hypothetical protein
VWKNSRAEAATGYNDDLVMCFAQGLWVRDTALKLRQAGIELTRMAVTHTKSSTSIYTGKPSPNDSWKQNINGTQEDITWLL